MTFLEACAEAVNFSKSSGKEYFVYQTSQNDFMASHQYDQAWLFRAYPGGRKVASPKGAKLIAEAQQQLVMPLP